MSRSLWLFFAAFQLSVFSDSAGEEDLFLTQANITGCAAFFPVKRVKLEKLIEKINEEEENDVHFDLPASSEDRPDELSILVSFGHVDATSFQPFIGPQDEYTTRSTMVTFMVPFLRTGDSAVPEVTLIIELFDSKYGGKRVIHPDAVRSNKIKEVDRIAIDFDSVSLEDGTDLKFGLQAQEQTCTSPNVEDTEGIEEVEANRVMSLASTDFHICKDRPDLSVDYCDFYLDHVSAFAQSGSNICEDWRPTADVKLCSTTVKITEASQKMRELLLLDEDVDESLQATCQYGVFKIFVKAPCIGQ